VLEEEEEEEEEDDDAAPGILLRYPAVYKLTLLCAEEEER